MPRTTPFHPRLAPLNEPMIWEHWAGTLAAPRYQYSVLAEYYAVRNAAGLLDTSPLFKYRFRGPDAERTLARVLARDPRRCAVGEAQYTCWLDEAGWVIEDGVLLRVAPDEYLLTTARPNLRRFRRLAAGDEVTIEDVSAAHGILALQGPHAGSILGQLTDAAAPLGYFEHAPATIAGQPVRISRTGYTGDLGYELWVAADGALALWDALWAAGRDYNLTPLGLTALMMARIEAGLLLIDVDFHSARHAWVDAQRESPIELGWGWMFRDLDRDDRTFIGRAALEREIADRASRWKTVGLAVDYADYERLHREVGVMPPKEGVLVEDTMSIYRRGSVWEYAGYASSFMYSSLLKTHIAIAKLPLDLCEPGSEVELEISIVRRPVNVLARVVRMPFFNPARKTARQPQEVVA